MSLNYQTATFQIIRNQHFRRGSGSKNPRTFRQQLAEAYSLFCKKHKWAALDRAIASSGLESNKSYSGSSNQRKEARGFSQVNAGLLFPRIRNRGPRIEKRGSRKRFRNNVLDLCNSREKAEGQRKSCKQGTLDSSTKGVMAEMDTFVASYYWFTNAGSYSAVSNSDYHSRPWPIFGTTISSTARRSCAQACRACAYAPAAENGVLSVSLLGVQRKYQTGRIASTNNESRSPKPSWEWIYNERLALIPSFGKEGRCRSNSQYTNPTEDGSPGTMTLIDASQAVEAWWKAEVKQAGFFPASRKEHKLQTTTHIHIYTQYTSFTWICH